MNKHIATLAVASFLSFGAAPVLAAEYEPADINRFVEQCDGNKDGMVSKQEFLKKMEQMWDKHDSSKKGLMDKAAAEKFLRELFKTDGR